MKNRIYDQRTDYAFEVSESGAINRRYDNDSFEKLCKYTLEVCKLDTFPDGMIAPDGDRWLQLAKAWETLLSGGSGSIFLDAVHRIMWGIPPHDSKPEYDCIVSMVVDELLSDGDAFEAWDSYVGCDEAIGMICSDNAPCIEDDDTYCFSVEHYEYLSQRTLCKIRYEKEKYASTGSKAFDVVQAYEAAIKRIIPEAKAWNEEYWFNENHILDELIRRYGVDYREWGWLEYGKLLLMLISSDENEEKYAMEEAWYASNIKTLPLSLAEVIWPNMTEEKILLLFLTAEKLAMEEAKAGSPNAFLTERHIYPVGYFDYKELRESWLYKTMLGWIDEEWVDSFVKQKIFNLSICV